MPNNYEMTIVPHDQEILAKVEKYLMPASLDIVACVDERQDKIDGNNGVKFPGGTYGIVDAIKTLTGSTEEEAWDKAQKAGIPMGAHTDSHHGELGCGYGRLVQTAPESVGAAGAVPVADRFQRVTDAHGTAPMLYGEHAPTHATINYKEGLSIDPDQAVPAGFGIFNYDYWAAKDFGKRLGIDPVAFADHLKDVYTKTVTTLTSGGVNKFYELR